jgi:nitroimidazol reductase NimA-like FMN-containing flavoprotein (pyridoxamine 5'-phosphate oxidase superfamily)
MAEVPRGFDARKRDALARLAAPVVDGWVATAGEGGVHLVPLSLAWIDECLVVAVEGSSLTARNLRRDPKVRVGVGPTRDVVMVEARFERVAPADEVGERYAAQADWDPRDAEGYEFLVLRPTRIQAWREVDEIPGRTLMKDGVWLS